MMFQNSQQYKVLARKYRPSIFADLIGQEALVRTLSNAISSGRIAQAYMLTGIRGVGKTTSARIIAKALNCTGADGKGMMTPNPCGMCENCIAISEDRHIDVQEIDAASNTQVDNIREIIQSAKYNPQIARYKVYIIDEVHMLSKGAANALLKLLEEPPQRVKFIFATTEIRKVPVTILSRCQRFDLRRVDSAQIAAFFKTIVQKEEVQASDEAIDIIAKCADGSVRDGLSLLDQAIAHSGGKVSGEMVRAMLGLADKSALFDLFENLMSGNIVRVLEILNAQRIAGADALMILQDLSEIVYFITKMKIEPKLTFDATVSEMEKNKGKQLSEQLSMAVLTRCWQMLLKGIAELKMSSDSFTALEMLMIRIAYASEVATPADIIRDIKKKSDSVSVVETQKQPLNVASEVASEKSSVSAKSGQVADVDEINSLVDIVRLARQKGFSMLALDVEKFVHIVEFNDGKIRISLSAGYPHDIVQLLIKYLREWTGKNWDISVVEEKGKNTLKEEEKIQKKKLQDEIKKQPLVSEVLETFPDAVILNAVPIDKEDDDNEDNALCYSLDDDTYE